MFLKCREAQGDDVCCENCAYRFIGKYRQPCCICEVREKDDEEGNDE